jgi:hypothetical protein
LAESPKIDENDPSDSTASGTPVFDLKNGNYNTISFRFFFSFKLDS